MGYEVHYASNFNNPIYSFNAEQLVKEGIILHQINVEKSPRHLRHNLQAFKQLKQIIDEENIDIVHCHNPMGGVIGRMSSHFSRRRPYVIYTAHGFHFYKGAPLLNWLVYYPAEAFMAHFTDEIVTINKEDYDRANHFRLKPGGFIHQIHGVGVNTDRFRPRPEISKSKREELGIPVDAFHIVTAAELNTNKNQRVIIEAIASIADENIYYTICGKGPNEAMLREQIKSFHLERRVRLIGYRTDMDEILQTADLFAFPSFREGLGIAAVEALFCSVPLLAADNRGTREYAVNEVNSLVCHKNDVSLYSAAIKQLKHNDALRWMLTANAAHSAEAFSIQETARVMEQVYKIANMHC